jgi:Na+-translocating ferredoxin:NAD+ oxidoreductase RnfG subunit
MKRTIAIVIATVFAIGGVMAQQPQHQHQNCPHQHQCRHAQQQAAQKPATPQVNADGIELTLAAAFPEAKSVKKGEKMTEVYNAKGKLIGYGLYSKPASNGIKGYNGETPVLIALSPKQVILGVWLLENQETPKFAQKVENAGFYKSWNGLTVKQALKKEVDVVSGATYTSNGVIKSVQAALKTL